MNSVSSKQLLGELIKELSPASDLLIGNIDQFLKKQHAYRNACAHNLCAYAHKLCYQPFLVMCSQPHLTSLGVCAA